MPLLFGAGFSFFPVCVFFCFLFGCTPVAASTTSALSKKTSNYDLILWLAIKSSDDPDSDSDYEDDDGNIFTILEDDMADL